MATVGRSSKLCEKTAEHLQKMLISVMSNKPMAPHGAKPNGKYPSKVAHQ